MSFEFIKYFTSTAWDCTSTPDAQRGGWWATTSSLVRPRCTCNSSNKSWWQKDGELRNLGVSGLSHRLDILAETIRNIIPEYKMVRIIKTVEMGPRILNLTTNFVSVVLSPRLWPHPSLSLNQIYNNCQVDSQCYKSPGASLSTAPSSENMNVWKSSMCRLYASQDRGHPCGRGHPHG